MTIRNQVTTSLPIGKDTTECHFQIFPLKFLLCGFFHHLLLNVYQSIVDKIEKDIHKYMEDCHRNEPGNERSPNGFFFS